MPTLAQTLCDGTLIEGFAYNNEPLNLARATIFVPTRRAARELRSAFMDHLGHQSVLLPKIKPLGEFDEDALLFEGNAEDFIRTLEPVDSLERQLILGRLIAEWTKHLTQHLKAYYEGEDFTTPVSTADAFWLAQDLAALIDQLQTEDLTFDDIKAAGEAEASDWWSITLAFLEIIRTEWPKILSERNRLDPAAHRNQMLRGEAERLRNTQPQDPVIVAGSTGTIPATADLIAAVATLPMGAVILPGYDLTMGDETRAILEDPEDIASAIGHPQYGMHLLVKKIGASGLIEPLGKPVSIDQQARKKWVGAALEPAPRTAIWRDAKSELSDRAFENVALLVAANEHQEAASIAAALREAIADPLVKTAFVTPDRMLARRVIGELARYGIEADDSGGTPFDATLQGAFAAFTFASVFQSSDPANLLALLKNPLVQIGVSAQQHGAQCALLEKMVLRGAVGRFDLSNFAAFAQRQIDHWHRDDVYKPNWLRTMTPEDEEAAVLIATRINQAFGPLIQIAERTTDVSIKDAIVATIRTLEALTKNENGKHSILYDGEAGTMLRSVLTKFLASETNFSFEPSQWPEIFRAATSGMLIKPKVGGHPRIAILGALEARLQTVDFMVLGGLNEGVWPQQTSNDAFLTRGMKARMKMQPPERRIGLAAHDFQMAMGQKRLLLTRSARLENAPAVASRWLQRLETLAGGKKTEELQRAGYRYAQIARARDHIEDKKFAERPKPIPPVAARPKHFSVTEIERLRRDPYAIYAKKILSLYPLEPLVRDPDAATRGTLLHKILEEATKANINYESDQAADALGTIADMVFGQENLPEDIEIIWRARFDAAISGLIDWERSRNESGVTRYAELQSDKCQIDDTGVTLGGRADRMDLRADGRVDVIDFKTGGAPSAKQVKSLLSPQMPLEAALLKRGAFPDLNGSYEAQELLYVTLGPSGKVDIRDVRGNGKAAADANELADQAWEKLVDILKFYNDPNNGYISRAIPKLEHDYSDEYDHLARVMEWSAGVDSDGSET